MSIPDRVFTVDEVSERLRCHASTVYAWIKKGQLHAYLIGDTYRISEEHLAEFLEGTTTKSGGVKSRDPRRKSSKEASRA